MLLHQLVSVPTQRRNLLAWRHRSIPMYPCALLLCTGQPRDSHIGDLRRKRPRSVWKNQCTQESQPKAEDSNRCWRLDPWRERQPIFQDGGYERETCDFYQVVHWHSEEVWIWRSRPGLGVSWDARWISQERQGKIHSSLSRVKSCIRGRS